VKNFLLKAHPRRGPTSVVVKQNAVAKGYGYCSQEVGPQPNSSCLVVKQWNFFLAKAKNINFFVKNFNPQILSLFYFLILKFQKY